MEEDIVLLIEYSRSRQLYGCHLSFAAKPPLQHNRSRNTITTSGWIIEIQRFIGHHAASQMWMLLPNYNILNQGRRM